MDNNELNKLEALAKAATPGPWNAQAVVGYRGRLFDVRQGISVGVAGSIHDPANASYIAAANPAAILELIALARRAAPPIDLNKTRAEFEAWAELTDHQKKGFQHDIAGWYYFDDVTQDRWEAWCAALARASSAAPAAPTAESIEIGNRLADTVEVVAPAMLNAGTTECLKRLVGEWREALAAPTAAEGPSELFLAARKLVNALDVLPRDQDIKWKRIDKELSSLRAAGVAVERAAPLPTKEGAGEVDAKDARIAELEARIKKFERHYFIASQAFHNFIVGNQSAWIEWQHGAGAESAMTWIHNGLCGPGNIPDEDEPNGKNAQAWCDEHMDYRMEPDEKSIAAQPKDTTDTKEKANG